MMKLEYWDRFVFDGPAHDVDYGSLLNSASGHLPKFGFETKGLWHSHVGYFAEPGLSSRRLINLNIDAFDVSRSIGAPLEAPEQLRSVGIYSMVQDDQGHRSLASGSDTVSSLEEMHTILKLLLADVITRQAAERISLNAGNMS
ncbi:MAG TPA: hypothetical protein VHL98_10910 [Microvirga sp.]|jgi:hypothetical protein|nr:hypothetical protein [Microvirga sp.]